MRSSFFLFYLILVISFFTISSEIYPQETGILRGFVTDSLSGEALAFCNVFLPEISTGASTNDRGLYLVKSIPANKNYLVRISYVGYESKELSVFIKPGSVTQLDVELKPLSIELQTVEKVGEKVVEPNTTDIGLQRLSIREIEALPKGVETDVLRSLQYLPGVQSTGDVSAQYYVRGSTSDQNLVLLNNITVYNPFHSLGLFSVIDPEMINSVEFYKGGFTAEYGGRLSSVLSVVSKEGNKNRFGAKASASLLTGKLLVEGPIPDGSFMITGRKTHSNDVLSNFLNDQIVPIDFYDMSFKLNYSGDALFDNAKINLFGLISGDNLEYDDPLRESFTWKNNLLGFEWWQIYDVPVSLRFSVSLSNFEGEVIPNESAYKPRKNSVNDVNIGFEVNSVFESDDELVAGVDIKTVETNLFLENKAGVTTDIQDFAGNFSVFGKYKFLRFENFGLDIGTRMIVSGLNSHSSGEFEPRVSTTYRIFPWLGLKAAWGIYIQEMATINDENEIISLFEPWVIIPEYLGPSRAIQYTAGIDLDIQANLSISAEGYFKNMNNLPTINENKFFASDADLVVGSGESYGYEFLLKYGTGWFNLTSSYTLSWAYKEIDNYIYYPKYDTRHSANINMEFNLGNGWSTSAVWSFTSGLPFTELVGFYDKYYLDNIFNPWFGIGEFNPYGILGDRNIGRLPEYHRLDLGVTKKMSFNPVNIELSLNLINAYDRANIFYFERDTGKRVNMLPLLLSGTIKVEI